MPTDAANSGALNTAWANGSDYQNRVGGLTMASHSVDASDNLMGYLSNAISRYYEAPDGTNFPFRLADFNKYKHNISYLFTGNIPFKVDIYGGEKRLGGTMYMNITLGIIPEDSDREYQLEAKELLGMGLYYGVCIARKSGTTNNNSWQSNGWDFLFITTKKKLSSYTGKSEERFMTIEKIDDYHYQFGIKIPAQSDGGLTNSNGYFDSTVGKIMNVYPITCTYPFTFLDSGDSYATIQKIQWSYEYYAMESFTLQPKSSSVNYKDPTVTLISPTINITYGNGIANVQLGGISVMLKSNGGVSNYVFYVSSISTSVIVVGTNSSGSQVTVYKTLSSDSWDGGINYPINLNYVAGSTSSRTVYPNAVATVGKTQTPNLTNKKAYLQISVSIYNRVYDTYVSPANNPGLKTLINLDSNYV
jgi:hypothetical protein